MPLLFAFSSKNEVSKNDREAEHAQREGVRDREAQREREGGREGGREGLPAASRRIRSPRAGGNGRG